MRELNSEQPVCGELWGLEGLVALWSVSKSPELINTHVRGGFSKVSVWCRYDGTE